MVISKTGNNGLNLAALHIAAHMQREHSFYFKLSDGDKDTFVCLFLISHLPQTMEASRANCRLVRQRYGFWALDLSYSTAPWWLSTLGFHDDWEHGRFCGIAMVQVRLSTVQ